jgi:hypothetical protein
LLSFGLFDRYDPLRNLEIKAVGAVIEAALPALHGLAVWLLA